MTSRALPPHCAHALSTGATLVRTDERIAPADGVGAVLRYSLL